MWGAYTHLSSKEASPQVKRNACVFMSISLCRHKLTCPAFNLVKSQSQPVQAQLYLLVRFSGQVAGIDKVNFSPWMVDSSIDLYTAQNSFMFRQCMLVRIILLSSGSKSFWQKKASLTRQNLGHTCPAPVLQKANCHHCHVFWQTRTDLLQVRANSWSAFDNVIYLYGLHISYYLCVCIYIRKQVYASILAEQRQKHTDLFCTASSCTPGLQLAVQQCKTIQCASDAALPKC